MAEAWYVLRSKPRKEDFLTAQLRIRKFETFNPHIRVQTVNPRARKVRPYFPGYVFVRVDLDKVGVSTLQWISGAIGLVSFGGEPAYISDEMVRAIQNRVAVRNAAGGELPQGLKPGEIITVDSGPFAGYEAIFDTRLAESERVRVLLNLLSDTHVRLELPASQVRRNVLGNRQFTQSIS